MDTPLLRPYNENFLQFQLYANNMPNDPKLVDTCQLFLKGAC